MPLDDAAILSRARECLDIESRAIRSTAEHLGSDFIRVVRTLQERISNGQKLIITGVGKNVPIGQKIAGTFNSTGVPTAFLDPNQALHGDLGLCLEGDICLLFSNSGETEDLLRLLPALKRLGVTCIAVTAQPASSLAKFCGEYLCYHYTDEACPLNLAPTASTTAALALGDALAMVFLEMRGFTQADFARFHPAGSLGKALLLKVDEIMRSGERFAVGPAALSVQQALMAITRARCGSIALTDAASGQLCGVFSDGDFRRAALLHPDILQRPVANFMTRNPVVIRSGFLAVDALRVFERSSVNDIIVVNDQNQPLGIVDGQDMPKIRIV